MEEEDIIKKTKEEKLKKLAGNFIWGTIQIFCQKNGINHYESQILSSDSGVSSYLEIEKGKYLNLLFLYSSYETTLLYLPVLYDCAKKIVNPLIKIRSKYINNWRAPKNEIPKEDMNRKDSYSYVKERLRNLGVGCEIFEYDDFFRIKINSPKKICPMEARISFDSFYDDLIFFEDFVKMSLLLRKSLSMRLLSEIFLNIISCLLLAEALLEMDAERYWMSLGFALMIRIIVVKKAAKNLQCFIKVQL